MPELTYLFECAILKLYIRHKVNKIEVNMKQIQQTVLFVCESIGFFFLKNKK